MSVLCFVVALVISYCFCVLELAGSRQLTVCDDRYHLREFSSLVDLRRRDNNMHITHINYHCAHHPNPSPQLAALKLIEIFVLLQKNLH